MAVGFAGAKRRIFVWGALGLAALACSARHHDCYETRNCPEADAPIDIGSDDDWWNTSDGGEAGQARDPEPGNAGSADTAGSSAAGDGGAPPANGPARVLRVSPNDGALGVSADARIVIAFNQPMDTAATEAAYESDDLPATELDFSWNESATTLTLSPRSGLRYASGAEGAGDEPAFPARVYHYGLSARAQDRQGQPLAAASFSFSTLRQVNAVLPADAERTGNWTDGEAEGIHNCMRTPKAGYEPTVCVGDDPNNVRYTGFLSFDFSALPSGIERFTSARLLANASVHGTPEALGASRLEYVTYAELGEAALGATAHSAASPLFVAENLIDQAQLALNLDVSSALSNDYEKRDARMNRSQYRLAFAKVLTNAHWDDVELPTSSIRLAVSYLVP